jgi:thiamine monophosphate synthase
VFSTPGKGAPAGIEQLAEVCAAAAPFSVLGVGGIDESNYRSVIEHGAAGFAAIRFLNDLENLKKLYTR